MKIDVSKNLKTTTCYTFELFRDNKCVQKEKTHNVLCQNFFNYAPQVNYNYGSFPELSLCVGSGSGTPAATDTALFNLLWNASFVQTSRKIEYSEKTESTDAFIKGIVTFTIPATSTYVGTITECGLFYVSTIYTHALLLDTEGNPINIEKTDLDILVVTVEITITCIETDTVKFVPMQQSPLMLFFSTTSNSLRNCLYPRVAVLWSAEESLSAGLYPTVWRKDYYPIYYTPANATLISATTATHINRTITLQGARLGSAFPDNEQLFIKGLLVSNFFVIPFPNTDIFPAYPINGIDVGVGDGSTVEFECPLNYFIKDTDKVYLNGVLQTRGVDYVLDNENNNQAVSTLMAANEAIISGGIGKDTTASSTPPMPIFRAVKTGAKATGSHNYAYHASYNFCKFPSYFTTDAPLFFDMKKEVRVNFFQVGKSFSANTTYGGVKYTVWYSDDNATWIELGSAVKTTADVLQATFDVVTARYFKITVAFVNNTSGVSSGTVSAGCNQSSACNTISDNTEYFSFTPDSLFMLGYKGSGIIFTTPPAVGDIITMDAELDLPMKNSNFVFDVDLTITY